MKDTSFKYQTGFGNSFESEAVEGALPCGRNNPRSVPFDLYCEQLSGTAFTRPRHVNLRTWVYRQQPSVVHNKQPFKCTQRFFGGEDPSTGVLDPNPMRWSPIEDGAWIYDDFLTGMHLMGWIFWRTCYKVWHGNLCLQLSKIYA